MSGTRLEAKGFFASLLDFGFTSFITLKFLKLIYMIVVGVIGLVSLILIIGGFSEGSGVGILLLFLVPIMALYFLITARISMEIIALFFRIGENTTLMATALRGTPGSGPTSVQPAQPTYGAAFPAQPPTYGAQPISPGAHPAVQPPTYGAAPPSQYGYPTEQIPPPPPS